MNRIGIHAANARLSTQQINDLRQWPTVKLLAVDHLSIRTLFPDQSLIVRTSGQGFLPSMKMVDELRQWASIPNVMFEIDNEPDWKLPNDWINAIWTYRYQLLNLLPALRALGCPLIAPAMAFPIYEQNEMYKCYVFNAICKNVFMQFDGIAIHQYSGTNMLDGALKDLLTYYEREFPEKDLYVTEFGLDPKCKQDRLFNYQAYYDYLEQHPRVKAACYFIQNGSYSFEGFELGAEQQELLYQTIEV